MGALLTVALAAICTLPPCRAMAAPLEDAAAYPSRFIRLIVPTAANGAGDALAREIANRLAPALGTKITVENRPGAT